MKPRTVIEILVTIFVLIAVAGFGVIRYFRAIEAAQIAHQQLLSQQLAVQQGQIDQARLEIDVLVKESKTAQAQIQAETNKRLAAEAARQADAARSAQQIADLASQSQKKINELQETIKENKPVDLTSIISSWRPRVAMVRCQWVFSNGTISGSGSGTLFLGGTSGVRLITNSHVVSYQGYLPSQCTIRFPDDATTYTVNSSHITVASSGIDAASISIPNPSQYLLALSNGGRCASAPVTGDSVIILGYPSIGSQTDITATEGIVSGTDGDYFITSAKVERGNSGGAAILSKQNCYAGIPSFVDLGQIEALARILNQRVVP